jgi:hypothetical protein
MDLSRREAEILTRLRDTNSRKLVATELRISVSRVHNAVSRVRAKRNEAINFLRKIKPFRPVLEHQRTIIPDREPTEKDIEDWEHPGEPVQGAQVTVKVFKKKARKRVRKAKKIRQSWRKRKR